MTRIRASFRCWLLLVCGGVGLATSRAHGSLSLTQVQNIGNTVLANYTYDALGRRITFNDPVAGVTTRYYYDGQSVIEERNAADARVRYHVNGNQFIDERIATFTQASGQFSYYLGNNNFSVIGTGNADGTTIERLDYSSTGDFAGGGPGATSFFHDADSDLDIDLRDVASFQRCFKPAGPVPFGCSAHDFDTAGLQDNDVDLSDYANGTAVVLRGRRRIPSLAARRDFF